MPLTPFSHSTVSPTPFHHHSQLIQLRSKEKLEFQPSLDLFVYYSELLPEITYGIW